jgi:5-dehydro-2-deoxygluconokinase
MALSEEDVDEAFRCLVARHRGDRHALSRPNSEAAQLKAIRIAKANGRKVAFDIDYRPNLWVWPVMRKGSSGM